MKFHAPIYIFFQFCRKHLLNIRVLVSSTDRLVAFQKTSGGKKAKRKSQDCCVTFNLLSVHARTSQADILHVDQKAAKCTTCKQLCGNV